MTAALDSDATRASADAAADEAVGDAKRPAPPFLLEGRRPAIINSPNGYYVCIYVWVICGIQPKSYFQKFHTSFY